MGNRKLTITYIQNKKYFKFGLVYLLSPSCLIYSVNFAQNGPNKIANHNKKAKKKTRQLFERGPQGPRFQLDQGNEDKK